jgi:predicted Rossmann fold nucleotide-binding protein DprA/Smf involved in DNA uptake
MNSKDRDKLRIHVMLTARRGEAFTLEELAQTTGLPIPRILSAGIALVKAGMARKEENYLWVPSYHEIHR